MTNKELNNLPFYSWNCITINTKSRDIDLVIRNEEHMMKLIRFLILVTTTVDGRKNTGTKILETLNSQDKKNYRQNSGVSIVSKPISDNMNRMNELTLVKKTLMKYRIMMIRAKMSYEGLRKQESLCELIAN